MFKKITDNLLTSSIAALIVVLFLVGIGFAVGGGIVSPGTFTSGASQKGLVGQWRLNSDSEKVSANDIISSWNGAGTWPYETFTSSGLDITSAVETGAAGNAFQTFSTTVGKTYRVSFNLTLNSGSLPSIFSSDNQGGGSTPTRSLDKVATAGLNSFTYKAYATRTEYIQFYSGSASNFSISDFSLKEVQTADTTPYENNGTVYGADIRNHGYNFNGSSDYIDLTTQVLGEDHTVSFWATGGNDAAMLSSSNPWGNYIKYTNSWVIVYSVNNYNFYDYTMNFGTWYYITVVTIGDDVKVYIDGQELNKSIDNISGTGDSFEFRYIGARSDLTVFYDGSISDLKIYDSALTVSQIGDLYQGKQVGSPVLDMPLKSGPKDLSGNDNDGIVTGATLVGEAASFDGTDDYISITTDTLDDLPSDDFSVSAWAKFDVLGVNTEHRIFNKRQSAEGWFFEHTGYGGSGQISMFVDYTGTNANTKSSVGSVVVDTWYHLVGVFDSSLGSSKVYINGVEDSSSVVDGTGSLLSDATKDLLIGVDAVGGNNMDGYVSDARIYSRTLSDDEIEALYNNGSQSEQYISVGSDQKGLVGHWKLDQDGEKVGSEIITAQENRDFSSANNWANTNMNSFDTTSDLSLSGVGGQWSYLFHSYGPMTAGKRYRVIFDASGMTGTWQIRGYNSDFLIGNIVSGANNITFTNIGAGGIRITNTVAGSIDLDNFSIKGLQTKDSTTNSNHGTLYQDSTIYTTDRQGQSNKAMEFNGTSDYMLTADNSDLDFDSDNFTLSAWVQIDTNKLSVVANKRGDVGGGGLPGYAIFFESGYWRYVIADSGTMYKINTTQAIDVSSSYHLVTAVRNGNSWLFYYDGTLIKATDITGLGSTSNAKDLLIGWDSVAGRYMDGEISDVRIYNRALSLKEIQDLYGSYNTELRTGSLTKGLVGSWDLKSKDEKVGSELITNGTFEDYSGTIDDLSNDTFTGWFIEKDGTGLTLAVADSYIGSTAIKMNEGSGSYNNTGQNNIPVTAGKNYRVEYFYKTESSSAGSWGIYDVTHSTWIKPISSLTHYATYTKESYSFTAPVGCSLIRIYLRANSVSDYVWYDNVILKELQTKDSTPYSNHGTVYGATVADDYTSFDGGGDVYVLSSDNALPTGNSSRTLSTWIKADATQNAWAMVASYGTGIGDQAIFWNINDGSNSRKQLVGKYGENASAQSNTVVCDGGWHMITLVLTESGSDLAVSYYIDGQSDGTAVLSTPNTVLSGDSFAIGGQILASTNYDMAGDVSNVKVYNRALTDGTGGTPNEIQMLYNKGR